MRKILFTYAVLTFLSLSSCATLFNFPEQKIKVNSDEEVNIWFENEKLEVDSKNRIKLKRDSEPKQLTLKKKGFVDQHVVVMQNETSPLYYFSIIPWGVTVVPIFADDGRRAKNYPKEIDFTDVMQPEIDTSLLEKVNVDYLNASINLTNNFYSKRSVLCQDFRKQPVAPFNDKVSFSSSDKYFGRSITNSLKEVLTELKLTSKNDQELLYNRYQRNFYIGCQIKSLDLLEVKMDKVNHQKHEGFVQIHMTLNWTLYNAYQEKILDIDKVASSGQFAFFRKEFYDKVEYKNYVLKEKAIGNALKDGLKLGMIDLMKDSTAIKIMLDSVQVEKKIPPLVINESKEQVFNWSQDSVKDVTILVENEGVYSSAALISSDGYVVSTYSTFRSDSTKVFYKDREVEYDVVSHSRTHNLVLLKCEIQGEEYLKFSTDNLKIGHEISILGIKKEKKYLVPLFTNGLISGRRKSENGTLLYQLDGELYPEMLGGPVIDEHGCLLGIIHAKLEGKLISGIGFFTPTNLILQELKLSQDID